MDPIECADTDCLEETHLARPHLSGWIKVKLQYIRRGRVWWFCSQECVRESLDDVVGRALSSEGRVVMRVAQ
jgi:hypothetical protein